MATLRFEDGAVQFRQRIVVSLLSNRPLLIRNIRSEDLDAPGLRPYEASFLRLIDRLTNGSKIEINTTGTQLRFFPGVLLGGNIQHDCPVATEDNNQDNEHSAQQYRSIGWFLEGILPLAPFGKEALQCTLTGITDGLSHVDPSVDYLRASAMPLARHFGLADDSSKQDDFLAPQPLSIRVTRRGGAPLGGGQAILTCPVLRHELRPLDVVDPGLVKRIRGTAISTKVVSTSLAARVAYSAKGVLHRLLPDVWIHTDAHSQKNHKCGPSPSLSMILTAESTLGCVWTAECCLDNSATVSTGSGRAKKETAEDLGQRGAALLLEEIRRGGCIDTGVQSLAFLWMCLSSEDVSRIRLGTLSEYSIGTLRLLKHAFGVEFKVKPDTETNTVLLSCLGTGYRNMARAST